MCDERSHHVCEQHGDNYGYLPVKLYYCYLKYVNNCDEESQAGSSVRVSLYQLHIEYKNTHSTSKERTYLGSEHILADPHNPNQQLRKV